MQPQAKEQINVFAQTNFRNKEVKFGIKQDDRRRHVYVIGKTGMGKTTMIENMILQDINAGNGLAFVDPHGEAVQKILDFIPTNRVNDVLYFNPADMDFPIAFNPLEAVGEQYKHLIASGLMGVFKKIWVDMWSARMEYILNNTILALLETPGNTMLGITRTLVDKKFRKKILDNVKDPIVKAFFLEEYENWSDNFRNEAIAAILNKVGQFLSSSVIRNIVGQPKSTVDLRQLMDEKKILLLDLSKGRIGEDNSALLGAMFITKIQLAAMSRVDIPEEERPDFYLYVDEFQNFATESFATILSEARKYRLALIMAHQYIGQLVNDGDTKIRDAVFGNVGTIITFRVGAGDAELLEQEFTPVFEQNELINLSKYHIYLKLMINGVASRPFSAVTLPPIAQHTGNAEKIIRVSRERYGKDRKTVEEKINRWMGQLQEAEHEQRAAQNSPNKKDKRQPNQQQPTPEKKQENQKSNEESKQPEQNQGNNTKNQPIEKEKKTNSNSEQIWQQAAEANHEKTTETVKKTAKKLKFDFSEREGKAPAPQANQSQEEKQTEPTQSKNPAPDHKTVQPGQKIQF